MREPLFLTWFSHRRTTAICERLGLPLVELVSPSRGARRYLALALRTIALLTRRRPGVLLVQNPSLVLALLALVLRPFFRYRLVQDAHNEAVEPYLHKSGPVLFVTNLLLRKVDLTIVTNRQLARSVTARGGRPLVLPDGIPVPPSVQMGGSSGAFKITLISTFAGDEPFDRVIEAARRVGNDVQFHVTGNPQKLAPETRASLPPNVTLTGFLAEHDYWQLLASSDAVMDLTTMDNCLVCGAYEAISVGRPLILSGNEASRELFERFSVFVDNTVEGILTGVQQARAQNRAMLAAAPAAREAFEREWQQKAEALRRYIAGEAAPKVLPA